VAREAKRPDPSAWRRSREKLERTILDQLVLDRDVGRKVQLRTEERAIPSSGLTLDDLREAARERATEACRRAMRKHESPEAVLRRALKRGEAA
jgi:hypothetical protein